MPDERGDSSSISGRLADRISIGVLARTIPRELVDEVLAETGKREKRSRRLPAHVVVYFVIAMAIFRDGYEEVLRKLVNGLSFLGNWREAWTMPTTGAISQARDRLKELPMHALFDRIAVPLAKPGTRGAWLRSWRLMAIDGVQIDVPDSDDNKKEFRKAEGGTRRPFPQIHAVGLGECGTHAVVAAALGTIHDGEPKLAARLLATVLPGTLVLADRGFSSFELWAQYLVTGADLLWRVTTGITLPVTDVLPDGSYVSVINSRKTRGAAYRIPLAAVDDPRDATHIPVRVID